MIEEIMKLIDAYWKFDEAQYPISSWHDKQDLLTAIEQLKNCNLQNVSVSFDDEIDAELERRRIVQYNDDDDDPHWDEGKLYWARKMFKEGAKWANER